MARRTPSQVPAVPRRRASDRGWRFFAVVRLVVLLLMIAVAAGAGWLFHFARTPVEVPPSARMFAVEQGASFRSIARGLAEQGILRESYTFVLLGRLLGKTGSVRAGVYQLPERITPLVLIGKFARGEVSQSEIVFIEGWTFSQIRAALDAHPGVRHETLGLTDSDVLRRLKASERDAEGLFFPDTYHFNTGASDLQVLTRAYQTMQTRLGAAWAQRAANLPYDTPYQALTMASIVEKETGRPEDRTMIAAVFINRLKRGMRLQTDPSVIYGLGARFDGNLRKRDLEADGPYNTYTRAGLPPSPIAMPGQASIDAALNPASSSALYFVARGDGSSQFSRTLEEHNRAVQKFQLKR